ncbi:hypothetical protein IWW57_004797, partial [Coemansia sp. S610]
MHKPATRGDNDEADAPAGSSLPLQRAELGSNRASLVFQQLHASIALPNSPSHRNSGAGPWALRRSVTEGAVNSHRNNVGVPATSLTFDQQWWGEPEQYFAQPGSPAWSYTSPYVRAAALPSDTRESPSAGKRVLGAEVAEEVHPPDPPDERSALLGAGDCQSSRWRDPRTSVAKRGVLAKAFLGRLFPTLSSQQTSVLKAVLAYAIAALFPFVPVLRDWLGDLDYMSPHLVTNATIWFHAAKTRSGLAEGGLVGVIWVCVTSCVTYLALFIAEWLHCAFAQPAQASGGVPEALPLATQSKVVSLVVFVFGYSWILAFFKANANRASVGTATAISNIALYLVMLREAPIVNYKVAAAAAAAGGGDGKIPWPEPGDRDSLAESVGKKTEHVLVAVLTGMAISIVVGWVVRPMTAGQELRAQLSTTFSSFRRILPQLLAPIVSEHTPSNTQTKLHGAKPEELKAGLREHRQRLQQLKKQLDAIALEPSEWHVWARRSKLAALVTCLEALSLHLSSMSSGLELRVIDHNSDAFVGDLDVEAYSAVIRKIREPVVRLGNMCDHTLAAVHDLVDSALNGDLRTECSMVDVCQCGDSVPSDGMCMACGMPLEDVDPATRRVLQLRVEMTEAIQAFHADYDAAVGDLTAPLAMAGGGAGPKPGSSTTEEQLFIVYFFVFSLREFVDELFDILPQVAAVCRQPPGLAQSLWRSPQQACDGMRALGSWVLMLARGLWDTGATTELETRYEVAQFTDPRSLHAPQPTTRLQRMARSVWRA